MKLSKAQARNLGRLIEVGGIFTQTSRGFNLTPSHKGFHTTALYSLTKRGLVSYGRLEINALEDWVDTYIVTPLGRKQAPKESTSGRNTP